MVKKRTKKKKKDDVDIKVNVRNLNKLSKMHKKNKRYGSPCSGFWVFGSALAMILSYTRSESILWAILHGILSWFYILFRGMQIWGWI